VIGVTGVAVIGVLGVAMIGEVAIAVLKGWREGRVSVYLRVNVSRYKAPFLQGNLGITTVLQRNLGSTPRIASSCRKQPHSHIATAISGEFCMTYDI
jgi:hypothetical protein